MHQIARILDVTAPVVTQYLKGVRGKKPSENEKRVIDALAEKAGQRINGGMEPLTPLRVDRNE